MKKIYSTLLIVSLVLLACQSENSSEPVAGDSAVDKPAVALPFTPSYSSSFEIGNPAHSALILQGSWKDWETNNLDNMKNWIADTIVAFHSNGNTLYGADSMIANWKRVRARYTSVIDTVQAVISTRSTDRNEEWVLVWAKEINTTADGKKDTVEIMETWKMNKAGKADLLFQYERSRNKK